MLVDDSEVVRVGLAAVLAQDPELEIVGQAATSGEAVTMAERLEPDLVLLDVRIPEEGGIEAGRQILEALPATRESILDPGLRSGVLDWVMRSVPPPETPEHPALTPQEQRIVALVAEGKTNKEIAVAMDLSPKTVKNYLHNVFEKLGIQRRSQAAALHARKELGK
jgi:DNA-binding NarL/FixJ family response regulator